MRLTPEIIAGMQQLALEQRGLLGPRAPWHVGDLAWGLREHEGCEPEWKIRLRVEDGRVVAWSWLKRDRGVPESDVHPEYRHLLDEILAEPEAKAAVAYDDDGGTRTVLARHGFVSPGKAPDGCFAAYVLVWPDDENGVALFEPVGTRAEFRRRGLGAAVPAFALRRLHEEGMRQELVGCESDAACALDESVGFHRVGSLVEYSR